MLWYLWLSKQIGTTGAILVFPKLVGNPTVHIAHSKGRLNTYQQAALHSIKLCLLVLFFTSPYMHVTGTYHLKQELPPPSCSAAIPLDAPSDQPQSCMSDTPSMQSYTCDTPHIQCIRVFSDTLAKHSHGGLPYIPTSSLHPLLSCWTVWFGFSMCGRLIVQWVNDAAGHSSSCMFKQNRWAMRPAAMSHWSQGTRSRLLP